MNSGLLKSWKRTLCWGSHLTKCVREKCLRVHFKKIKEWKIIQPSNWRWLRNQIIQGPAHHIHNYWTSKKAVWDESTALWKTWLESFRATALLKHSVVHLYEKKSFYDLLVCVLFELCFWELYQDLLHPASTEDSWPKYFFFIFLTSQEQCLSSFLDNVIRAAGRWHYHCLKFMAKPVKNIFH